MTHFPKPKRRAARALRRVWPHLDHRAAAAMVRAESIKDLKAANDLAVRTEKGADIVRLAQADARARAATRRAIARRRR